MLFFWYQSLHVFFLARTWETDLCLVSMTFCIHLAKFRCIHAQRNCLFCSSLLYMICYVWEWYTLHHCCCICYVLGGAGPCRLRDLFTSMRHQESVIFLLEYLGFRYTNVLLVTTLLLSVENKCALINKTAEKLFLNSCNLPAEWWCFPRSWSLLA